MEKNLIRTQGARRWPAVVIENAQAVSSLSFGLTYPTSQRRASGSPAGTKKENKEVQHLVEADTQSREQDSELPLALRSEFDDLVEPLLGLLEL
jgi:hypothetical protein